MPSEGKHPDVTKKEAEKEKEKEKHNEREREKQRKAVQKEIKETGCGPGEILREDDPPPPWDGIAPPGPFPPFPTDATMTDSLTGTPSYPDRKLPFSRITPGHPSPPHRRASARGSSARFSATLTPGC